MDEMSANNGPLGLPTIALPAEWNWELLTTGAQRPAFEMALRQAIVTRRWFASKTRAITALRLVESIAIGDDARLLLLEIEYSAGPPEIYQVPLARAVGEKAEQHLAANPQTVWAIVKSPQCAQASALYDAPLDAVFCRALLDGIASQATQRGGSGEAVAWAAPPFQSLRGDASQPLDPQVISAEQSNTSVAFGSRFVLKIFRRVEMGQSPDLEVTAFLTARGFSHVAPLAGAIEYRRSGQEPWTLGVLQAFVPNQGDAWRHTHAALEAWLQENSTDWLSLMADLLPSDDGLCAAARRPLPREVRAAFGKSLAEVELLGKRTAEMHLALAGDGANPAFAPQPFSAPAWRLSCHRAGELAGETFRLLGEQAPRLRGQAAERAAKVLLLQGLAADRLRRSADDVPQAAAIRCHGDYHLGQVLVAGDDFVIIDFEGEPARPLAERREKQLALVDVAGMIRSFHYASCSAASNVNLLLPARAGEIDALARAWYYWTSTAFLAAYERTAAGAAFLPQSGAELASLLEMCLLRKALYELRYELNNRPNWVHLPLAALADLCTQKTGQV